MANKPVKAIQEHNDQLTVNFNRKEFKCRCGCGLDNIDIGMVNRLQVFRDILQVPIRINSACRCVQHNKNEGGQSDSYHLERNGCRAIDWTIDDKNKLRRFGIHMEDKYNGGWHYYLEEGFIHSDSGQRRRW